MRTTLLKSAALIAVVVVASACESRKIAAGDTPTDAPGDSPRTATSPHHKKGKSDHEPHAVPERPSADNTGPSDPGALRPTSGFTITTRGAVYENLDISDTVHINADNVTLRNFRINTDAPYGIQISDGHSGILIEDGEITGGFDSAGILGVGFTARRLHIHDGKGDGMKVQGSGGASLVEYCFVEGLGAGAAAPHTDANHTRGGSNITFRYNNFYMPANRAPYAANSALMLELKITNMVIDSNWMDGGNYTVYCPLPETGSTVYVRNNLFGRDYRFGTHAGSCAEWTNNRWEDTGGQID